MNVLRENFQSFYCNKVHDAVLLVLICLLAGFFWSIIYLYVKDFFLNWLAPLSKSQYQFKLQSALKLNVKIKSTFKTCMFLNTKIKC